MFAAPHGFSQRTTSFIACACQGIHRTPLRHLIALIFNARPHYPRSPKQAEAIWTACFKSIAEQTMDPRPASHPKAQKQVQKDQCHTRTIRQRRACIASFRSISRRRRPDNSSLHDVNAGLLGRQKSENRSQHAEIAPDFPASEFWLLIFVFSGLTTSELACRAEAAGGNHPPSPSGLRRGSLRCSAA